MGEGSPEPVEDLDHPEQVPEYSEEEIIEAIKGDPVANALLEAIGEAYTGSLAAVKQLESETAAAIADLNDAVEALIERPAQTDLLGGLDGFIEKFQLQDQIKAIFSSIPAGINQLTGADPVSSGLGEEFLTQAKEAYLEREERKNAALVKLEQAMASGDEVFLLSPEAAQRAREEGLIKDEN